MCERAAFVRFAQYVCARKWQQLDTRNKMDLRSQESTGECIAVILLARDSQSALEHRIFPRNVEILMQCMLYTVEYNRVPGSEDAVEHSIMTWIYHCN